MILGWFFSLAFAASLPAITVPSGQFVVPGSAVTISGISIAETGAGPTTQFTTTVTASGILTATGSAVTGNSTSSLTIAGTSAQTNTALATLAIDETCAVPAQCTDAITINTHDASNNAAPQQQIPIVADGNKYLTFSTMAAAQARSNQQALALGNSGVTQCWWAVVPLAGATGSGDTCTGTWTGGGAVKFVPGDACYDESVPPNAVQIVASFTGSISGNTLTVPSGTNLRAGLILGGNSGITPITMITGGSGTIWTVSKSQTVASGAMVAATTYCNPSVLPSAWLTSAEQSSIVTAPNAGFAAPTISNGAVVP